MKTWIALFRGINVGGAGVLPMAMLKALLGELGCENVRTYIQSGNVVFEAPAGGAKKLAGDLSQAVERRWKFAPQVMLLTPQAFQQAIDANPFPHAAAEPKSLHFFFLQQRPKQPDLTGLEAIKAPNESFQLIGDVFYLHAPDGVGRSKLAAKAEKLLGVPATARNYNTVEKIAAMLAE